MSALMQVYASVGDPAAKRIDRIIPVVAGRSEDEIIGILDRYDIEWNIVDTRSLSVCFWQGTGERFVIWERAPGLPISKCEPEPVDDLDWLISNMAELRDQCGGQWIAIAQGQIVASASTVLELEGAIETGGIERPLVTFISEQEPIWNMAYLI